MTSEYRKLGVAELAAAYRDGGLSPVDVTEEYLAAIEAGPVYRELLAERARAQAQRARRQFAAGIDLGPLQGVPVALKDLVATEGVANAAGSRVLAGSPPAASDAPVAARLDAAGAVFLGRTNMTELAFSGLGVNPHFGTPACVFDEGRIPGGSSSGSAVAVASGLACAAVGSDTGGSVRIPAAFNGIVGLKTSEGAIPTDGCVPLSFSLDTIGPLARTPEDAWLLYRAMAALPPASPPEPPTRPRLLAPVTVLQEGLEPQVAEAFARSLERLRERGCEVVESEVPLFEEIERAMGRFGSLAAHEAHALHGQLIDERGEEMDPRVTGRVLAVRERPSSDYIRLQLARATWRRDFWEQVMPFDAVVAPTVAILPPLLADLAEDERYIEANRMCLRNTSLFNAVDGAAISVSPEPLPVGTMIVTAPGGEATAVGLARLLLAT